MLKIQIGISSSLRSVAHKNNLTNFYKWFYFRVWSLLLITANQSSLSFLVFRIKGGGKLPFFFFWFWKMKKKNDSLLLNNIKSIDPKETKQLSHILTWIFKKLKKKKKFKSLKKCLRAFSAVLVLDQNGNTHNFFYLSSNFNKLYAKMFVLMRAKNLYHKFVTAS